MGTLFVFFIILFKSYKNKILFYILYNAVGFWGRVVEVGEGSCVFDVSWGKLWVRLVEESVF